MARTARPEQDDLAEPTSRGVELRQRLSGHLRVTGFGFCVLALGLLIWARLMLVTSHPRTAIAEPSPEPALQVVGTPSESAESLRAR
ncbi:MAG: hypothetical protein KF768_08830 [Phycisphaeraceae bacterium]|nr:hypothetical protein [Phycisphaeraceae bacterium]